MTIGGRPGRRGLLGSLALRGAALVSLAAPTVRGSAPDTPDLLGMLRASRSAGLATGAPPATTRPSPARGGAARPPAASPAPLPALPMLPSVARVKITSHDRSFAIASEVSLPRGEWKGQDLHFHVAFGAPGPLAIDAHLVPVGDGAIEPDDAEVGAPLPVERVARRPVNAYTLLGRENMAGVVVHIKPEALAKALERGNMASLRIRSVVDATEPDAEGASSLIVRLGAPGGNPLTLGRIVAGSAPGPGAPPLTRVEARLCGPEADAHPLAVAVTPRVARPTDDAIAPVLSLRHASDDLCVRLWQRTTGR